MDIKYHTTLNNNPTIKSPRTGYIYRLEPLSIDQIEGLETIYNSGNQFPVSLRELLFVAGQSCYVLDYGLNDTQQEMQDDARKWLASRNFSITRPFFVVDVHNGSDSILFVYLDEGVDDPMVYFYMLDTNPNPRYLNLSETGASLTVFVNERIDNLQRGFNPY